MIIPDEVDLKRSRQSNGYKLRPSSSRHLSQSGIHTVSDLGGKETAFTYWYIDAVQPVRMMFGVSSIVPNTHIDGNDPHDCVK